MQILLLVFMLFCSCKDKTDRLIRDVGSIQYQRIIFVGDWRPSCKMLKLSPKQEVDITYVLRSVKRQDPDRVVVLGDYLCAWPGQDELARAQRDTLYDLLKKEWGENWIHNTNQPPRVTFLYGNHEAGHIETMRAYLGNSPKWSTTWGGVTLIGLPSDVDFGKSPAEDNALIDWTKDKLKSSGIIIVAKHECPWQHGVSSGNAEFWNIVDPLGYYHPDLFFCGHDHKYERRDRWIVSGNGGAKGWEKESFLGYTMLDISNKEIKLKAIEVIGHIEQVRDKYDFKK